MVMGRGHESGCIEFGQRVAVGSCWLKYQWVRDGDY